MALIQTYFDLTQEYQEKYGDKTILLMQVGAFFEVYGKKYNERVFGSHIHTFSQICELNVSTKSKVFVEEYDKAQNMKIKCNVLMAGFRDYMISKYTKKLTNEGYTVIVYKQNDENPSAERELLHILSPGTDFDNTNEMSNMIMCIKIFVTNPNLITPKKYIYISYCLIDIITGNVIINEIKKEYFHNPTTFDDVERIHSMYNPVECIILFDEDQISKQCIEDIILFIGITSKVIRRINSNEKNNPLSIRSVKCENEIYQRELLEHFYDIKDYSTYISSCHLNQFPCALSSFVFLLDYIFQHNPHLIRKIKEPMIQEETYLTLGNHSLKQLNIINNSQYRGKYSSVLDFLNNCVTTIGKREFKEELLNPIQSKEVLERKYQIIENLLQHTLIIKDIHRMLSNTVDIERVYRKIVLSRIKPSEMNYILNTLDLLLQMNTEYIVPHKMLDIEEEMIASLHSLRTYIHKHINVELCRENQEECNHYTRNFFQKGISEEVDILQEEYLNNIDQLKCISEYFTSLIQEKERKNNSDLCKLHETDKSGFYLKTTNKRSQVLLQMLKQIRKEHVELVYCSSYDKSQKIFSLHISSIKRETRGNDTYLMNDQIHRLNITIQELKEELKVKIHQLYKKYLNELQEHHNDFTHVIRYIRLLDVNITKALLAEKYNYTRPILEERDSSFVEAYGLRHVLIEHINQEECYVPNDIILSHDHYGFLLFGTNAVGKSSLIKSLGIAVIMAQAGMYVPCSRFVFQPFERIFTRIIGNDNIFKGLSTFAVEMSELRTILNCATKNSLVLGDELCSGTENGSAVSIFAAGLLHLHALQSKFIFATHFHEITEIEEIRSLDKMSFKHLSVLYDREKDCLIYNRVLKDGAGDNMYGLEVCKSLNLPTTFLDTASSIRITYYGEKPVSERKVSDYNHKKIMEGDCELCGKESSDIHHLQYQKYANKNGYIKHIHKNHMGNLIRICKECHHLVHKEEQVYRKYKTTDGIKLLKS